MEVGPPWPPCMGEAANHRMVRRLSAGVLSDAGKGARVSVSGGDQEGERKRTTDDVSKFLRRHRNRGVEICPGMSSGGACLLPERCPAWRWRELGPGSGGERGNLSSRHCCGRSLGLWPPGRREGEPQAAETARGRVPMRGTGTDRLVVAVMPGNAGGAKGTGHCGLVDGQPPAGGRNR
jgi:hypothetical protein